MAAAQVFDDTPCQLGEGALWHPERKELFWFDINAMRLYLRGKGEARHWQLGEHVSAAGAIDRDSLLVASETALLRFSVATGDTERICALEADNPVTRSNDGRADPWGGFWIGTMGKKAEPGAGAIYRYYRGELRQLFAPWTTPNALCFSPDRRHAYLADTPRHTIWRQALADRDGWPAGDPEVFLRFSPEDHRPDGAVTDSDGNLWCAHIGHAALTCHAPDGTLRRRLPLPARWTTCPAFGGEDMARMFVTSAARATDDSDPQGGMTFVLDPGAAGLAEPRVIL